jgi:hypothetical protein
VEEFPVPTLQLFDPALCCDTGVCGAEPDPVLARVTADLHWLAARGVSVQRYNLGQQPEAFAALTLVRTTLQQEGVGVLPLTILDGQIVGRGAYLDRATLARQTGVGEDVTAR